MGRVRSWQLGARGWDSVSTWFGDAWGCVGGCGKMQRSFHVRFAPRQDDSITAGAALVRVEVPRFARNDKGGAVGVAGNGSVRWAGREPKTRRENGGKERG